VTVGGKKVSGDLVNGVVKLRLPKMSKPGQKKMVVTYVPATGFAPATATLKIRVTKH